MGLPARTPRLVWLLAVSVEEAIGSLKIPAVSGPWGTGWDEEPGHFKGEIPQLLGRSC